MDRDDQTWPTDPAALLARAKELSDAIGELKGRLQLSELENAKLKQIVARLKRMQFGHSSERHAGQFTFDLDAPGETDAPLPPELLPRSPMTATVSSIRSAGRCRAIWRERLCATILRGPSKEPAKLLAARAVTDGCMSSARIMPRSSITFPAVSG
jgi:hypothetical protein